MADNIKELKNIIRQLHTWKEVNSITDLLVNDYDWGISVTGYRCEDSNSDFTSANEVISGICHGTHFDININRLQENKVPTLEDVLDWIAEHDGNVLNDFNTRFPGLIKEDK